MKVFLNNSRVKVEEDIDREQLLQKVEKSLDREIIETIKMDEVEVSPEYFKSNNIELDRLKEVCFITKKTDDLIEETLQEAVGYLPEIKDALLEIVKLYRKNEITAAAGKLEKCLAGIEWYTEVLNRILSLITNRELEKEGYALLVDFDQALSEVMIAMQKEKHDYQADILEVELVEYIEKFNQFNHKLLERE